MSQLSLTVGKQLVLNHSYLYIYLYLDTGTIYMLGSSTDALKLAMELRNSTRHFFAQQGGPKVMRNQLALPFVLR